MYYELENGVTIDTKDRNWIVRENELMLVNRRQTLVIDWNEYMKCYNRNHRNTLSIQYWNRGSSYLGGSSKGREKLENIRELFTNIHYMC